MDENCKEIVTKDENSIDNHEGKNSPCSKTDEIQNTNESSLVKTDQSDDEIVSDVRPTSPTSSSNGHVTNPANGDKVITTDDQSDASEKAVFISNPLDQYLSMSSQHNSETNLQNKHRNEDSLGRIAEIANSRQEFSANDFLLDQTESQSITSDNIEEKTTDLCEDHSSFSTKDDSTDITSTLKEHSDTPNSRKFEKDDPESFGTDKAPIHTNRDSTKNLSNSKKDSWKTNEARLTPESLRKTIEHSYRNEELPESVKSKDYNSKISQKPERRGTEGNSKDRQESNDEFSEILSSGNSYDYRVRKIENPELVSSSYGSSSALSDFTDDDRDLNFIPGIHRMSSKSFSSSFEKKSVPDSFVSFDENGLPLFDSSHYTDYSSSQPSSTDDANSSRFGDLSNEWDMFEDLLNVEEEHFSQPDVRRFYFCFPRDNHYSLVS